MKLFDFTTYLIWLNLVIGIFCFAHLKPIGLRYLLIFQIISAIAEAILIYILPMEDGIYVRYVYCFLKPFEYLVLVILFNVDIREKSKIHFYLITSIILMFIYAFYNLLFQIDSKSSANNVIVIEGAFILILVLLYFKATLQNNEVIVLSKEPLFWIATGLLFFYTGNIIATGFYHRLREYSEELAKSLYTLNFILGMLLSILTSFAYIVAYKNNRGYE
jgi:hypothetical protein